MTTQRTLTELAYRVEQQGQGENPVLNAAADKLKEAGKYQHQRNLLEKALRSVLDTVMEQSPGFYVVKGARNADYNSALKQARAVLDKVNA